MHWLCVGVVGQVMVADRPRTTNQQGEILCGNAVDGALRESWQHHGTLMLNRILGGTADFSPYALFEGFARAKLGHLDALKMGAFRESGPVDSLVKFLAITATQRQRKGEASRLCGALLITVWYGVLTMYAGVLI